MVFNSENTKKYSKLNTSHISKNFECTLKFTKKTS